MRKILNIIIPFLALAIIYCFTLSCGEAPLETIEKTKEEIKKGMEENMLGTEEAPISAEKIKIRGEDIPLGVTIEYEDIRVSVINYDIADSCDSNTRFPSEGAKFLWILFYAIRASTLLYLTN